MMCCLICDEHVQTGDAYLVLNGFVSGQDKFEAKEAFGLICYDCMRDPQRHEYARFPLKFRLEDR